MKYFILAKISILKLLYQILAEYSIFSYSKGIGLGIPEHHTSY